MGINYGLPFGISQTLIAPLAEKRSITYTFWDLMGT